MVKLRPALRCASRVRRFSSSVHTEQHQVVRGVPEDSELIGRWMADPTLVDPVSFDFADLISPQRCFEVYTKLHLLHGFDLPEFLAGARVGYCAVTQFMFERDWEALAPLVRPECLEVMRSAMDGIANDGRRVVDADADGAIAVYSATLSSVSILDDEAGTCGRRFSMNGVRRVHLDVWFVAQERWRLHDFHENAAVQPFDGKPFERTTLMRWEGETSLSDETRQWRLYGLDMQLPRAWQHSSSWWGGLRGVEACRGRVEATSRLASRL
eukprot:3537634-Prymnesium_polylepis.1